MSKQIFSQQEVTSYVQNILHSSFIQNSRYFTSQGFLLAPFVSDNDFFNAGYLPRLFFMGTYLEKQSLRDFLKEQTFAEFLFSRYGVFMAEENDTLPFCDELFADRNDLLLLSYLVNKSFANFSLAMQVFICFEAQQIKRGLSPYPSIYHLCADFFEQDMKTISTLIQDEIGV